MLNKSFGKKFSEEQFSTLVFFHKNAYSARYLRKTDFWGFKHPFKKTAAGGYCGIFSMFFRTPFYITFSNHTFASTICTFFFEISLICLGYQRKVKREQYHLQLLQKIRPETFRTSRALNKFFNFFSKIFSKYTIFSTFSYNNYSF